MVEIHCDIPSEMDVAGANGLYDYSGLLAVAVSEALDSSDVQENRFDIIKSAIYSVLAFKPKEPKTEQEKSRRNIELALLDEQLRFLSKIHE